MSTVAPHFVAEKGLPPARRFTQFIPSNGKKDKRALSETTSEALIRRIADARDREAFAALFHQYAPRVKAFCKRGGLDDASAEELAQETLVTVWRKADSYRPERASASTWIFTIARNKKIDLIRRESRPEIDPDDPWFQPNPNGGVEETYALRQSAGELRKALKQLPENQAEIVRKAFLEEKSHQAISHEMDLPLGTVKSRVRLALARLRVLMAGLEV